MGTERVLGNVMATNSLVSFETLCSETIIAAHGRENVNKNVVNEVLSRHGINIEIERDVLLHEVIAKVSKRRTRASILTHYSPQNAIDWVKVLLDYGVSWKRAMEKMRFQYQIDYYSERSTFIYRHVSAVLGKRSDTARSAGARSGKRRHAA